MASNNSNSNSKPHIVIFPFLAQGHTIPLLDLSRALSRRGLKITIITTPSNASSITPCVSSSQIKLRLIPFPKNIQGLPENCESMSQISSKDQLLPFLNATKLLRDPFEATLRDLLCGQLEEPPTCVISDSFLGWSNAVCRALGVPRIVFNGMGVFSMAVKKSLGIHQNHLDKSDADVVEVKGVNPPFELKRGDLPGSLRETKLKVSNFFLESDSSDLGSWGVIANSFVELEKSYVSSLESLYGNGTRTFCVGPLFLYDQIEGDGVNSVGPNGPSPSADWANWLNRRCEDGSHVIYVAFGSHSNLSDDQLDELAHGLEISGEDYIWVVRSNTWNPPSGLAKGLIVGEWVDQKWVLAHRAVLGFLSHCGWNSVLESMGNGVPVLAWPMQAEQHLNAKYLVEELKVGIGLPGAFFRQDGSTIVGREEISEGVKELMGGVIGKQVRDNTLELGKMAKRAVQVGGSSHKLLHEIIEKLEENDKEKHVVH